MFSPSTSTPLFSRHCGFRVTGFRQNPVIVQTVLRLSLGSLPMKKLILALSAVAAFSAPALAADMAAKAPMMPAPVATGPSWTGWHVGGGLGSGVSNKQKLFL